ncbi:MAG: glycosyltransferase [Saprospiraceae bacterium]|nr:glycosyltransferase [Saprospiraceae bacterium]
MKKIILTVTNDLVHDRRMHRICHSLVSAGFGVTLIGREYPDSPSVPAFSFQTVRIPLWWRKGKLFYLEYQIRLFFKLLWMPCDVLCAIDLDSILPVTLIGGLRGKIRVYDAHEFYTEVPELIGRPIARNIWEWVARFCIPRMDLAYSVGPAIALEMSIHYQFPFGVVRNVPVRQTAPSDNMPSADHKILWYQGALNQGRGLESVFESLAHLPDYQFWLAGEGDLSADLRTLAQSLHVQDQVRFLGWVSPSDLSGFAVQASIGLNLLDGDSLNYYYSLANKTFDYIQASLPAIHMDFPEYRELQKNGPIGVLIPDLIPQTIVDAVRALEAAEYYQKCQLGCQNLALSLHWAEEEKELIRLYQTRVDSLHAPE